LFEDEEFLDQKKPTCSVLPYAWSLANGKDETALDGTIMERRVQVLVPFLHRIILLS